MKDPDRHSSNWRCCCEILGEGCLWLTEMAWKNSLVGRDVGDGDRGFGSERMLFSASECGWGSRHA